jgi:ATP/maltotriose-dependent transcriptional regulator MalT
MLGLAYTGMAELLYEWNDLPAATAHLSTGIDLAERGGLLPIAVIGRLALARVRQAQGDSVGARIAMRAAEQIVARGQITPTWLVPPIGVHRAQLALAQGDVQAATRWAETARISPEDDLGSGRDLEYLTLARLLLAQGEIAPAQRLLERLLAAAEAAGCTGHAIEILALQALALQAHSHTMSALVALERALTLAAPEGYIRVFVDAGEPMAALVAQSADRRAQKNPTRAYAERLLRAFPRTEGQGLRTESAESTYSVLSPQSSALVEPLSEREIEVLRLVASGLSDRAIAEHLILAIGTVKKHLNNIYGKLGVHTRTQALARASDLNLL